MHAVQQIRNIAVVRTIRRRISVTITVTDNNNNENKIVLMTTITIRTVIVIITRITIMKLVVLLLRTACMITIIRDFSPNPNRHLVLLYAQVLHSSVSPILETSAKEVR